MLNYSVAELRINSKMFSMSAICERKEKGIT